ncbi:hypothetical protein [Flagellimonas nanhaiensis]|nr:hypothetical protein [Allomuricauda nanhaiensis]
MKTVDGTKDFAPKYWKVVTTVEVSLRIRFLIPEAAFGVDFFFPLSPNLKKDFIYIG